MFHSEEFESALEKQEWEEIRLLLGSENEDAQLIFWGPDDDIKTALETIEERCLMAFERVPNETRKSFEDGTTIFERVLPGADRMYPDTDSSPIPLANEYIEELQKDLPMDIIERVNQMLKWEIPDDTFTYILSKNHYRLVDRIITELGIDPVFAGTFIGHRLKFVEGHYQSAEAFNCKIVYAKFRFLKNEKIEFDIANKMIPVVYEFPKMDFESVLTSIGFKRIPKDEIISHLPFLKNKFAETAKSNNITNLINWIMGELREEALGNMSLTELADHIKDHN
ncbi:MAG: hypothetical protein FJY07_06615 [Bacteroidetes bacterium]|nr:hypothetical protein [Bacteroidota bacterium]